MTFVEGVRHHDRDTILVTGGMGNIGKYLVRELLLQGYKVIALDVQDLREGLKTSCARKA